MTPANANLLIVDDEELNREGLARRLQKHDYDIALAKNGREAIELLGTRPFDLVLLDIMMPGMNGLEVLKFLRRVDSLIDLPIIMVTAKGESEDIVEALELGANDYVTKPLDFPVVLARIRTQLALRRAVAQVKVLEGKLDAHNRQLQATATELAAANDLLTRDLEAAAAVQKALLPVLPAELPGAASAGYSSRASTRRDYLDTRLRPARRPVHSDVSGHGVAARCYRSRQPPARRRGGSGIGCRPAGRVAARLDRELTRNGRTRSLSSWYARAWHRRVPVRLRGHPGRFTCRRDTTAAWVSGFPVGVGGGGWKKAGRSRNPARVVPDGLTAVIRKGNTRHTPAARDPEEHRRLGRGPTRSPGPGRRWWAGRSATRLISVLRSGLSTRTPSSWGQYGDAHHSRAPNGPVGRSCARADIIIASALTRRRTSKGKILQANDAVSQLLGFRPTNYRAVALAVHPPEGTRSSPPPSRKW